MIQDIAPHIYRNEYKPEKPAENSYVMYFENGMLLADCREGLLAYPTFGELAKDNPDIRDAAVYLFSVDGIGFYLVEELSCRKGYGWIGKKELRRLLPPHLAFAGITAYQLHGWYETRRFCGRCASPMQKDLKERMMVCPVCHNMEYPKICPAVIVAVTDKNRVLLTKYAGRGTHNYALVAGFAEIGESIEDTVRREVMEEVGLEVTRLTYYKSQPWSFTDTLLFGFYCEAKNPGQLTVDTRELSEACWFEREEIPVTEKDVSLTNEMILHFKRGGKGGTDREEDCGKDRKRGVF